MPFMKPTPEWNKEGVEPPQSLKDNGFVAGSSPAAGHFDWLFHTVSEAIQELQQNGYTQSDIGALLGFKSSKTTADITYYVSTTGSDSNDGLTSETAFRTLQHAFDVLPNVILHAVTINLAAGTYNESIDFIGVGNGAIHLQGAGNTASIITGSMYINYTAAFRMDTIKIDTSALTNDGIDCDNCTFLRIVSCNFTGKTTGSTSYAINVYNGVGVALIEDCQAINYRGALTSGGGFVSSRNWRTGSGITYGISVDSGTISKVGTQPNATTPELSINGGLITGSIGQVLSTNGYQRLSSGLILQWGVAVNVPSGTVTQINLPITFPTNIWVAFGGINGAASGPFGVETNIDSTSKISFLHSFGIARNISWIAIGV
jgi:hypothetical protein